MGLFRDIGRRAEKLKREATEAAGETADYECADCGTPLFVERSTCPDCGSESVVARASASEGERAASAGETEETEPKEEGSESPDDA